MNHNSTSIVFWSSKKVEKHVDKTKKNKVKTHQVHTECISFVSKRYKKKCKKDREKGIEKGKGKKKEKGSPKLGSMKEENVFVPPKSKKRHTTIVNGFDIFGIHQSISQKFEEDKLNLSNLKERRIALQWIIDNTDNLREKFDAEEKLEDLEAKIQSIEEGEDEAYYRRETDGILKEYNQILNKPVEVDFMGKRQNNTSALNTNLIYQYLDIAKQFIDIDASACKFTKVNEQQCERCQNSKYYDISDDGLFTCYKCGHCRQMLKANSTFKDTDRVNLSSRYKYDPRTHFRDCLNAFQAKQNTTISPKVYEILRREIKKHGLNIKKLTKEHVYLFLRESDQSRHYEDLTLIYCTLTNTKPPDISYLESQLYEMFNTIVPIYEEVKNKIAPHRKNFLNSQYVLYQFLRILKYSCDMEDDFTFLKTREKLIEHDEIFEEICDRCSWTFTPTVG